MIDSQLDLNKPAIHQGIDEGVIYQPVKPYKDEHGTVVAHLLTWSDGELETQTYYSRGWAYWNFLDNFSDEFEVANQAMELEAQAGPIDFEIGTQLEAVEAITNDRIPHANAYWKSLVVRTAYDAITNVEEFANICRNSEFTQEQVQRMIDLAVGAVLSNDRFTITGFDTQSA